MVDSLRPADGAGLAELVSSLCPVGLCELTRLCSGWRPLITSSLVRGSWLHAE